jgi:hypothetical protein
MEAMMGARTLPSKLVAGNRIIGILQLDDFDYPWVSYIFEATPEFDELRDLFELQHEPDGFRAVGERMDALDLRLVEEDGSETPLHRFIIRGNRAEYRVDLSRAAVVEAHDQFWRVLGDECGPETCRSPGCTKLRIMHSVFCRRHHFRMIRGVEYRGTLAED